MPENKVCHFVFHRINPSKELVWPGMDPYAFNKCLDWIARNHLIVSMPQALAFDFEGLAATVTFDDAYEDVYWYALPVLEKRNIKATFFVVTECVENNRPIWTHEIDQRISALAEPVLKIPFLSFRRPVSSKKEKIKASMALKNVLKQSSLETISQTLELLKTQSHPQTLKSELMNWQQLAHVKQLGHEIGSHSHTHPLFTSLSEDQIRDELTLSKTLIETKLNHEVTLFAYPSGFAHQNQYHLLNETGYTHAFGTQRGHHNYGQEPFYLPRTELYPSSNWVNFLKTHPLYQIRF